MRKYFFLLIFCWANNLIAASAKDYSFNKITTNDPIKKIVKEIAKSNVYEYPAPGNAVRTASEQNIRFVELLKISNDDDLIKLATKYKNAVVRLYAYRAIVQKFKEVPKDILDQFNNDTSVVNTLRGNIADKTTVKEIAGSFLY